MSTRLGTCGMGDVAAIAVLAVAAKADGDAAAAVVVNGEDVFCSPVLASGASSRLGREASGRGSCGLLLAYRMHVS